MRLFERAKTRKGQQELPFIILDDLVCFPGSVTPLYISAKPAVKALETALAASRTMFVAFRRKGRNGVTTQDLSKIGCVGRVVQVMKLPNNSSRLLFEGIERASLDEILDTATNPAVLATTLELNNTVDVETGKLMRIALETFQRYANLHKKIAREATANVEGADAPHKLVDLIAANVTIPFEKKLKLFEELDAHTRLTDLSVDVEAECELLELKTDISGRVKKRMEQNQKEYFLNEQIRELNRELGKEDEDASGLKELENKFKEKVLPDDVRARVNTEIKRLSRLQPMTPEAGILRGWLEWMADLPWAPASVDIIKLAEAEKILNQDHYDLEEPKDRILDYLAVRRLRGEIKAPILCFVGPPGTGKTSLGKSLARALGRSFIRVSLGGVRDEAEIRGHRRTYVGSMPGKIIQGIRKSAARNPVFLLDEIDKLANDHRGDPASALLEVLDPEQNASFVDHYIELPYDLSQVLFVATANNLANIPHALRDRMEVIEIPGYTPYDKLKIAEGFIVPKQLKEHGLEGAKIRFLPEAIRCIIDEYTMEAGVRGLERHIAKVIRKLSRNSFADESLEPGSEDENEETRSARLKGLVEALDVTLDAAAIRTYLKKPRVRQDLVDEVSKVGVAYGMAWTEVGGTVMPVEVTVEDGKGEFTLTGSLGDVMKESARIAVSVLRNIEDSLIAGTRQKGPGNTAQAGNSDKSAALLDEAAEPKALGIKSKDVHIHVPEGAIPKDGPSAGITLCTALASALSGRPVNAATAMTGELTLTGRVLAVGGVREKVLAAHRHGLRTIILPEKNRVDADDLPEEIRKELQIHFVHSIDQVIELALEFPSRQKDKKTRSPSKKSGARDRDISESLSARSKNKT